MSDFPTRKITICHKKDEGFENFVVDASYRNTLNQTHSKNGENSSNSVLIRIFDVEGYGSKWFVDKGDIIVNREISDKVTKTPLTYLSSKYGSDNVHKVISVSQLIFDDEDIEELNHIKIGAI